MSLSNNFPAIKPSLNLDFANVKALDPRISFVRTTTATYYGTETAKAEENLLLQSQDFSTSWTAGGGVTVTANTEVAPDGTTTADTITATAATSVHLVGQTVVGSSLPRVMSVFAKKGTNDYIQLCLAGDGAPFANFDLDLGVVGTKGASVTSSITSVGNGWYRCTMEYTSASGTSFDVSLADSDSMARRASWTALGTETVFLWGAQLEQRSAVSAYTPTTTQAITNYIPVLETAASGEARFDHNPTTGESLGLLVEEQRTNLLTYSEQFDNAAWTQFNSSITANTIVAPSGELTGDKLTENTATQLHVVTGSASASAATSYVISVYAKAGERFKGRLRLGTDIGLVSSANFDLAAGTVSGTGATITAAGNGWYRVAVTGTSQALTTTVTLQVFLQDGSGTESYTGNGFDGMYIWGAQIEAASFPTSYIATTSASVTRNADAASMTGTNFSSWYRADEGTLYAEAEPTVALTTTINNRMVFISDGTTSNRIELNYGSNSSSNFRVDVSGVTQASINPAVSTKIRKASAAYKVNDFAVSFNAGAIGSDTAGVIPVVSQMTIGAVVGGVLPLNGTIKKIAFYPSRLTDAQLQALTS